MPQIHLVKTVKIPIPNTKEVLKVSYADPRADQVQRLRNTFGVMDIVVKGEKTHANTVDMNVLVEVITECIKDWDWVDEKNEKVPINQENVGSVPFVYNFINDKITKDANAVQSDSEKKTDTQ